MMTVQPKYEAIVNDAVVVHGDDDEQKKLYDNDDTAVVMAMVDDGYYYPIKSSSVGTSTSTTTKRRKASRSLAGTCCCITSSVCGCFLLLIVLLGIVWYSMIVKGVRMFTVETPIDFPIVPASESEMQRVSEQIGTFFGSIMADELVIDDLIVPAHIINGAIAQSDYLRGHAQIVLNQDEMIVRTSLPMDMMPGGKSRFFVSTTDSTNKAGVDKSTTITTTSFDLGKKLSDEYDGPLVVFEFLTQFMTADDTQHEEWVVNMISMLLFGEEQITPDDIVQKINLLKDVYENAKYQADPNMQAAIKMLNGIAGITIEPGQMIVRARTIPTAELSLKHATTSTTLITGKQDGLSQPIKIQSNNNNGDYYFDDESYDDEAFELINVVDGKEIIYTTTTTNNRNQDQHNGPLRFVRQ